MKVQLGTDASVCKSILLRHGCGKIKHLSTKQLWVQGAVESYGIKILKIPRDWNGSDLLTHPVSKDTLYRHLVLLGCTAPPHPGSLRGCVGLIRILFGSRLASSVEGKSTSLSVS